MLSKQLQAKEDALQAMEARATRVERALAQALAARGEGQELGEAEEAERGPEQVAAQPQDGKAGAAAQQQDGKAGAAAQGREHQLQRELASVLAARESELSVMQGLQKREEELQVSIVGAAGERRTSSRLT